MQRAFEEVGAGSVGWAVDEGDAGLGGRVVDFNALFAVLEIQRMR